MTLKAQRGATNVHCIQLAGRDPVEMAIAAQMAETKGADIIDINMGCPAKKVVNGLAGSALMRDEKLALQIVEAVVQATTLPVTLKMRLGWDRDTINAARIAKCAVEAGVRMITVHGRTRCEFYKGHTDWSAVHAVREAVQVPLIVNGDIRCKHDALTALKASGADGVMVGRAAYGKPWLPGEIAGAISSKKAQELSIDWKGIVAHHEAILMLYGQEAGMRHARKHLSDYMNRAEISGPDHKKLREEILTSKDPATVHTNIRTYFSRRCEFSRAAA